MRGDGKKLSDKKLLLVVLLPLLLAVVTVTAIAALGQGEGGGAGATGESGMMMVGAGLAIGLAGVGAGYAIGVAGAATMSAATERPELFFRGFLIVALGEAVAIYGLIVAILIWIRA